MANAYGNLLEVLPKDLKEEYFEDLVKCDGVRIERIVSKGQVSEEDFWYDQDEHEFVLVLQGAARLVVEPGGCGDGGGADGASKVLDLKPGNWTFLPAHCRHRVAWTDPGVATVWLAVFWMPGLAPSHN